jgi:hypothetical protein
MKTRRQNIKRLVMVFPLIAVLLGCIGALITVTTLTDQPIDVTKGRKVSASACGFQLLLFIPIMTNGRAERAFEALRESAGENSYIADVNVRERWTYAFVGTVYCTDLQATAYPKKALAPSQPSSGEKL